MNRRSFIRAGLGLAVAAPMVVRADSLMPVKVVPKIVMEWPYTPRLCVKEFKNARPWIGSITGASFAPVPIYSELQYHVKSDSYPNARIECVIIPEALHEPIPTRFQMGGMESFYCVDGKVIRTYRTADGQIFS